ncbi:MAG TPA: aminoglycoside phosphotransferase family protein [Gemmatimonadaceae bacterium]|nr:aminoglycoside phosphotransferase family protein [Gemmatimonadaceae bacterium]
MEEGWERPPTLRLEREKLSHLVEPAFPGASITEHGVIATGLANTNIRFRLHGHEPAYVLRLHTRDRQSAARERAVMAYLASHPELPTASVPVAPLVYCDPIPERGDYPYSIWGCVEGHLLQHLFPTLPASELVDIASACGRVLAAIAAHPFDRCGEFGPKLEIAHDYGAPSRFVPEVIHRALFEGRAGERLGVALRDATWKAVERTSPMLAEIDDRYTLVHADYKRSNLLMKRQSSGWTVAAVLDWEFACAGPPLIDVALFLRAGGRLPAGFRDVFVSAYLDAGGELPRDWLPLSRLIDLVSQVTFLDAPEPRPRVFAESTAVVKETLGILG